MTSPATPSGHDAGPVRMLALENIGDGSVRFISAEELEACTILTVHSDDLADEPDVELLERKSEVDE